jgi:hypothetical protein
MNAITSAIRELWGLFVEDPTFTLGILACLAVAGFLFPVLHVPLAWRGIVLFVLLALVLIENVVRSARATP